jgi:chloride channel protein, CIC family
MSMQTDPNPARVQTPERQESAEATSYIPVSGPLFREERFFLMLSIFIGILSGALVVCFRITIEWSSLKLLGPLPSPARFLLVPTLIGLLVAVLVIKVFPAVRGSGVNQTKAALYIYNGFIPFRTAVGKFITAALAIGSGQSLGPEDPSLQIGAALASTIGRRLRLSREKLRLLAPVGAAAGLAAAFNAPISAVLFVIEEVIGRWSAGILGAVVLSTVSSVMVTRWFLGSAPLFRIPAVETVRPSELIAYAVLGVIGGFASIIFSKSIAFLRPKMKAAPAWTQYIQPAAAGLIIGLIGYAGAPQVMGAGYNIIDRAMHDQFTWQFLALLAGMKILATTMSFVSGTPGGMFAPTLFVGAMLGGAVGGAEHVLFPHIAGTVGTYALVGMGVMFAGFLRAPMTAVFMVLEVSGNYSIIVPVIVASAFSYILSRIFEPVPIFDLLSRQDGLELPSMEEEREAAVVRVEDAMRRPPAMIVDGGETVAKALKMTEHLPETAVLIHLGNNLWTSVAKESLRQAAKEKKDNLPLASVFPLEPVPLIYPDNQLHSALPYLYEWPLVAIAHRAIPDKIEGVLSLKDALRAYRETGRQEVHSDASVHP